VVSCEYGKKYVSGCTCALMKCNKGTPLKIAILALDDFHNSGFVFYCCLLTCRRARFL